MCGAFAFVSHTWPHGNRKLNALFKPNEQKKPTTFEVNNCFYSPNYTQHRHLHSHSQRLYRQKVAIWTRTNWFWCMSSVCVCYTATHRQLQCSQWINYMLPFFFGFIHLCGIRLSLPLRPQYCAFVGFFFSLCCKVCGESAKGQIHNGSHWTDRTDAAMEKMTTNQ